MEKREHKLIAIVFPFMGITVMLICCYNLFSTYKFVHNAATAAGTVTQLWAGGSHLGIQFATANVSLITYSKDGLIFGYDVGDKM